MRTRQQQPSAQQLRVRILSVPTGSARATVVSPRPNFSLPRFQRATPNTALVAPRQINLPGIHSAILCHDPFIRSCLFESGRAKIGPDYEKYP